jgi:hypothetical protein
MLIQKKKKKKKTTGGGASKHIVEEVNSGGVNIDDMDESSTVNLPPKMNAVKKRRPIYDLTEEETNWSIQYLYKKASDSFTSNGRYTFKPFSAQEYEKYVFDFCAFAKDLNADRDVVKLFNQDVKKRNKLLQSK